MISRSRYELLYHFLSPMLLILTPFISFITYNQYSYATPEIWICLAGLVAVALLFGLAGTIGGWPARALLTAGLLVLFVDLQFNWFNPFDTEHKIYLVAVFLLSLLLSWGLRRHLSQIVTAVFATILVSTVVLESVQDISSPRPPAATTDNPKPRSDQLPIFVHLILDEHIGIEGIPTDVPNGREMRRILRNFFEKYGFRLYGRSYSQYADTYNSIPNIVNFSSEQSDGALISGTEPYTIVKNEYFEMMRDAGYNIHVYGSDYIDFCNEHASGCYQGSMTGIKSIEELDIPVRDKIDLIYHIYARRSSLQLAVGAYYMRLREAMRPSGWNLPGWWFKEARLGPVPSMLMFDRVTAAVAKAAPGDLVFVYLGTPHYPYVYDDRCEVYPLPKWEEPVNSDSRQLNDRRSRARRYGRYLEQVRCLQRRLEAMFQAWQKAGIFDRSTIVIHSDHGSKIVEQRALADNRHKLSSADYMDTFSTLFAVKRPGIPPGYDSRIATVQELLGEVIGRNTADDDAPDEQVPYVFLRSDRGKPMLRQHLSVFGDGGAVASKNRARSF